VFSSMVLRIDIWSFGMGNTWDVGIKVDGKLGCP
jgi:hypothetical protein